MRDRVLRVAAAAALAVAGTAACGAGRTDAEVLRIEAGSTVTVRAEVEDVIGPHTFVLAAPLFEEDSLLVVDADGTGVSEGDMVTVTGTVTPFDQDRIEDELEIELQRQERTSTVGFTEQIALTATEVVFS